MATGDLPPRETTLSDLGRMLGSLADRVEDMQTQTCDIQADVKKLNKWAVGDRLVDGSTGIDGRLETLGRQQKLCFAKHAETKQQLEDQVNKKRTVKEWITQASVTSLVSALTAWAALHLFGIQIPGGTK
jgi:hypothetical protein